MAMTAKRLLLLSLVLAVASRLAFGQTRTLATVDQAPWSNSLISSAVDGNGNPNYATFSSLTLTINGATTPVVMMIGGIIQVVNSNLNLSATSNPSNNEYVLVQQDTTNANLVVADFIFMSNAPKFAKTAPTCPASGISASNPSYWFDQSTGLSKTCTSNGGSYSAFPSLYIGSVTENSTPVITSFNYLPFRATSNVFSQMYTTGPLTFSSPSSLAPVVQFPGTAPAGNTAVTIGADASNFFYVQQQGNSSANYPSFNTGTSKQVLISGGGGTSQPTAIDFPEALDVPAANCNNTTGGAGWSIGSGGTVTCRAGTNNLGGYITITQTATTFAQFMVDIPVDWDSGTNPYIRVKFAVATDTTNGHTIIPQIKVSCPTAGNGTTSDDATFSAAQTLGTSTIGASGVANGFFNTSSIQIGATQMSGCFAGGMMIVQVGRSNTDTATGNVNFYSATVTVPRLLTLQAN